jgi:hypothetical protein
VSVRLSVLLDDFCDTGFGKPSGQSSKAIHVVFFDKFAALLQFLAHALECFTARFIAWRFDVHSIKDGAPCFAVDAKKISGFINASIYSAGFAESFHRKLLVSV